MHQHTKVYNLIILDESGSMESIRQATILGFNELIQSIQEGAKRNPELQQFIQFYSFNSAGVKEQIPLQQVETRCIASLDHHTYQPAEMTPLYDAIGHAVTRLRFALEKESGYAVLGTIFTDGGGNASVEDNRTTISNFVRELSCNGWVFTYIGTNHDVAAAAQGLSITNHSLYVHSSVSVKTTLEKEKKSRQNFYDKLKANPGKAFGEEYF